MWIVWTIICLAAVVTGLVAAGLWAMEVSVPRPKPQSKKE